MVGSRSPEPVWRQLSWARVGLVAAWNPVGSNRGSGPTHVRHEGFPAPLLPARVGALLPSGTSREVRRSSGRALPLRPSGAAHLPCSSPDLKSRFIHSGAPGVPKVRNDEL